MSFLAVYHHDNLLNPIKLLTHREDIGAVLADVSVTYETIDLSVELQADQDEAQLVDSLRTRFDQYPHLNVLRLPAIPAYAAGAQHQGEPEQSCGDPGLRLFLKGAGVLCLHIDDHLYALGCVRGDLVSIPANVMHWLRQGMGSECIILRLAKTPVGVECIPCDGGLAMNMDLPEIQ